MKSTDSLDPLAGMRLKQICGMATRSWLPWMCIILALVSTAPLQALEKRLSRPDRLSANNNEVAVIMQEVGNQALSQELMLGLQQRTAIQCTLTTDTAKPQNGEPKDWILLRLKVEGLDEPQDHLLADMLETYINSRMLGMTPRLSAERSLLRHRGNDKKITSRFEQPADPLLEDIRRHLAFPAELLVKSSALEFVFGKKGENDVDYLLPDGDLIIFIRMDSRSTAYSTTLPLDRRLLTHPMIRAEFAEMQPEIEASSSKMADDLGIKPQDKSAISRELKLYWRATRELFAKRGLSIISVDAVPSYQMDLRLP